MSVVQSGKGVDVNHRLSLELFRRAAELGDPEAQGQLGMRFAVGLQHHESVEGSSIQQFAKVPAQAQTHHVSARLVKSDQIVHI